jgi:serine/threonine protein kinase
LEALRDAIRGHRSLLEDGKILHRDVSENNIIITKLPAEDAPKGRLIDLDLAKELDGMPSGARHRTGTMQFMAIEVLEGKGHTYRHDLESFFYVFVWMCIRYGYGGTGRQNPKKVMRPKTNILRGWYTGMYTEIANTKQGHVVKNRFENVIAEFAPEFENLKPLARELRSVLFPIRDGDIFTGTFHDHSIMYDGMIEAFDRAITSLRKEEQANA